jgi:hypothetical protein
MANRYTQVTPSVYSPLTFEEIAAVPMMKRKAHDELAKQLAESAVKTDPLKVHEEEALAIKNRIEGGVASLSEQLASQGVTPEAQQQFYKINKEYRDELSPTGRLGKINAAKPAMEAAKKAFMDAPENKEIPLDVKKKRWEEHVSLYGGYEGEGDDKYKKSIINIGDLGAPGYEDLQKDLTWGHTLLGETTRTKLNTIGAHFKEGPFGGLIMVSGDGKEIKTTNNEQLKSLTEFMNKKWIDSKGKGAQYADFAYMDKQNLIDQINAGLGIMVEDKSIKDLNMNYQNISAPAGGDGGGGEDVSIIDVKSDVVMEKLAGNSFGQNQRRLAELEKIKASGNGYNPTLQAEYATLSKFVNQNNAKIVNDKNYKAATAEENKIKKAFIDNAPSKHKEVYNKILSGEIELYDSEGGANAKAIYELQKTGLFSMDDIQKVLKGSKYLKTNPYTQQKWKISNDYNKRNNLNANYYQLAPKTEKGEQNYKRFNNQLENVFVTGTENVLQNMGLITGVQVAGQDNFNLSQDDRDGIQDMLRNQIEPGSLQIAGFSENNITGMPSIKMSFMTKKDADGYDLSGTSFFDKNTKVIGADGERITFDFDIEKLSNIKDSKNVLATRSAIGELVKFLYENGGSKGEAIAIKTLDNLNKSKNKK